MKIHRKNISANILLAIGSLVLAVLLGTAMMIGVYCLPTERMNRNVVYSQVTIETEKDHYAWAPGYAGSGLDGYTDAIMLSNAVFRGTGDPVQDAMRNPRVAYSVYENEPTQSLIPYASGSETAPEKQIEYARYWHGYLVLLKPLLLFFSVSHIRMMNFVFQFLLLMAVVQQLLRLGGYRLTIPFCLAILWINPVSTALCMQYSSVYNLMLLTIWLMLQFRLWDRRYGWLLFLWLGIATAFFDFLTYPVAALGICLVLVTVLSEESWQKKVYNVITASMAWCFGYGGMWSGKWIMSFLLTGENTLQDAFAQIAVRAGAEVSESSVVNTVSVWEVIEKNLSVYGMTAKLLLIVVILLGVVFPVLFRKYRFRFSACTILPLLLIALYPFVWYTVIRNHSMIHYWMTHRNLAVTILALGCTVSISLLKNPGGKQYG